MKKVVPFFLFLIIFFAPQIISGDSQPHNDFELPLSFFWPFTPAEIVHDAGDFIFLGSRNQVLFFEVSEEGSYFFSGNFSMPETVSSIKTSPDQIFIGTRGSGLFVFCLETMNPEPLKQWDKAQEVWHIQVYENQVFVSAGLDGLYILNRESLKEDLFIKAQEAIWKTIFHDNILFLIDGFASTNLFVIDLKEPEKVDMEKVIIEVKENEESNNEIILPEENEVFEGEKIIPDQRHLATINRGNHIKDLAIFGDTLYVADSRGGLVLYDISNPVRITFEKAISPEDFGDELIHSVRAKNQKIIASGKKGLYFIENAEFKQKIPIDPPFANHLGPEPEFFDLHNHRVVFISEMDGVLFFNTQNLPEVEKTGRLEYPQKLETLAISQDRAFLASGIERIWELQLEENTGGALSPLSWEEIPGIGLAIVSHENHLYIASGIGISIVNKRTPGYMQFSSFLPFPYPDNQPAYNKGWIQDIALFNNIAFVAAGGGGIWIVDCFEPSAPTNLLRFSQGNSVTSLKIDPINQLLFAGGDPYLGIYDISEPHNPIKLKEIELSQSPSDMEVNNNYLYLSQRLTSDEKGKIQIFDYSHPENIQQKNLLTFDHPGPTSIAIRENQLLALSPEKGVEFFSLINPANPVPEVIMEIWGGTKIEISPLYLGIVSPEKGFFLFEYKNPTH